MVNVFILQHVHVKKNDEEDVKIIGIYSSRKKAEETIQKYKNIPGFKDNQESFYIDKYKIDEDHWKEGFIIVNY